MEDRQLETGLAIMRVTIAAFFLVWSVEKLIAPDSTVGIFSHFYMIDISINVAYAIGAAQTAIVLAFLAGVFKFWTYGALTLMHGLSTLSTYERLATPYTDFNHLFWAAVPVLGALVALFMLRERDRRWTLRTGS